LLCVRFFSANFLAGDLDLDFTGDLVLDLAFTGLLDRDFLDLLRRGDLDRDLRALTGDLEPERDFRLPPRGERDLDLRDE
jgi:hypothetical protein